MLKADYIYHPLIFKQASGTSRGILKQKDSWFIRVWNSNKPTEVGIGECSVIKDLSRDDCCGYEEKLKEVCTQIQNFKNDQTGINLKKYPSIYFGLETAFLDLATKGNKILFPSDFTAGKSKIPINGLIWMGSADFMLTQIKEKIKAGFNCIKIKIGAVDFNEELRILQWIRKKYPAKEIEIRVDANGAFSPCTVMEKLKAMSKYQVHSVEQPIKQGQIEEMAKLCRKTPLPIALDEELIGVFEKNEKAELLDRIAPQFVVIKPGLLGGFKESLEWINLAKERNIAWWITSALESNIGLNAIAQWAYTLNHSFTHGLGTGQLFVNNPVSPLQICNGFLQYNTELNWSEIS